MSTRTRSAISSINNTVMSKSSSNRSNNNSNVARAPKKVHKAALQEQRERHNESERRGREKRKKWLDKLSLMMFPKGEKHSYEQLLKRTFRTIEEQRNQLKQQQQLQKQQKKQDTTTPTPKKVESTSPKKPLAQTKETVVPKKPINRTKSTPNPVVSTSVSHIVTRSYAKKLGYTIPSVEESTNLLKEQIMPQEEKALSTLSNVDSLPPFLAPLTPPPSPQKSTPPSIKETYKCTPAPRSSLRCMSPRRLDFSNLANSNCDTDSYVDNNINNSILKSTFTPRANNNQLNQISTSTTTTTTTTTSMPNKQLRQETTTLLDELVAICCIKYL